MTSIERAIEPVFVVGLLVNPVAGLGGPSALKGSDQADIRALTVGRQARTPVRTADLLRAMEPLRKRVKLLVGPGEMGETAARIAGWTADAIGEVTSITTAADTRAIAAEMRRRGIEVLLFVGGDGTAVDILAAICDKVPVIGVPAGVKMHSAVFALSPAVAGRLAQIFLASRSRRTVAAEVMDLDAAETESGRPQARLHGTLRVPLGGHLVQSPKVRSQPSDAAAADELAGAFRESLRPGTTYIIGPGSTTSAILARLGLAHTLLGVDVLRDGSLIGIDADDVKLEELVAKSGQVRIVVTPIGGQGFIFGRGNQQIASRVVARVGREGVIVVATDAKLAGLGGRPLLVDTGDPAVDDLLSSGGYLRVLTGAGRSAVYPVRSPDAMLFDGMEPVT